MIALHGLADSRQTVDRMVRQWHSYWCGHVLGRRLLGEVRAWLRREFPVVPERAYPARTSDATAERPDSAGVSTPRRSLGSKGERTRPWVPVTLSG